ncbi:hypothetical protein [Streptomyces cyaneofuscatus]|uniref:hypothetical protein n=1 Tax=Streptomyces cyaneofuscatus TaxID=66883 RepID=UPI00364A0484
MMMRLGAGALLLFCYIDVVAVLAVGDFISDAGPPPPYGGPVAFGTGFTALAAHDAYRRRTERA